MPTYRVVVRRDGTWLGPVEVRARSREDAIDKAIPLKRIGARFEAVSVEVQAPGGQWFFLAR